MEERMIDDEYGRGVRLKKTKDGYVDATDELAEGANVENEEAALAEDEIAFAFPVDEEENEESFAEMTAEEVAAFKKRREEEALAKKAVYDQLCKEGEELLAMGSFKAAELKYEKALKYDDEATEASVGYWRAKTADFTDPDVLANEYVDESIESLEYDLGYAATDIIREKYEDVFKAKLDELTAEEEPLRADVEGKQRHRREILKARRLKRGIFFAIAAIPLLACLLLTVFFGTKNFTTRGNEYIGVTIGMAAASVVFFIVFAVFTNRFINACRMYRKNERLDETDDGARLLEIELLKKIYEGLLPIAYEEEQEEETTVVAEE